MCKSTISMAIFNSFFYVYQRVIINQRRFQRVFLMAKSHQSLMSRPRCCHEHRNMRAAHRSSAVHVSAERLLDAGAQGAHLARQDNQTQRKKSGEKKNCKSYNSYTVTSILVIIVITSMYVRVIIVVVNRIREIRMIVQHVTTYNT